MPPFYPNVVTSSAGSVSQICLLEVQTVTGSRYFWSDQTIAGIPSVLTGAPASFAGWIVGQPQFQLFGSIQTDTATIELQNVSGNTVERDAALALSSHEFIGAFIYFRLWDAAAEAATFIFMGTVSSAEIDDETLTLSINGFDNWSDTQAVTFNIDVACPLSFGSMQCGSVSPISCQQSYGTCSSIERFAGVVIQWNSVVAQPPLVQIAQPPPAAAFNPARQF